MTPPETDDGLRGIVRRAAGGARDAADSAFEATVGRVGHTVGEAALDATQATAQQVIEDLEPYLIDEAVPRIVAGITPYLTDEVIPEVLNGLNEHLTTVTVPEVVDGVTGHLVEVTVPQVVAGVTPRLVEDLLPRLLTDLRPYLEQQLVPQIVDALTPHLEHTIAPELLDSLMPTIRDQVAPDLLDALMPRIQTDIAPQLVDSLMPKIRQEVVPRILDDIVDDPRVRDLIREQSQGLFLDAIEAFRGTLADVDSLLERTGRRLLRRPPRPEPESGLGIVLAGTSSEDTRPARLAIEDLARQRAIWRALPAPPPPPGRAFTYAGAATRLLSLAIDVFFVGYLATVLFSNVSSLLTALFGGTMPPWLAAVLVVLAGITIPTYLGIAYWAAGRSLGMGVAGVRVCTADGRRPGFVRAMVRAWLEMIGVVLWVISGAVIFFDDKRRSLLDRLIHTEVRYSVPESQQRRHVRDAVLEHRTAGA